MIYITLNIFIPQQLLYLDDMRLQVLALLLYTYGLGKAVNAVDNE